MIKGRAAHVANIGYTLTVGLLVLALSACSFGKAAVDREEYSKVKSVAVLVYTVPQEIKYREDPRETSQSLLQAVAQAAAAGKGERAATVSYASFTEALNDQGLPFRVMSVAEVRGNRAFSALDAPSYGLTAEPKSGGMMGKVSSFLGGSSANAGAAPDGFPQFGLPQDWSGGNPLMGSDKEAEYLLKAINALNVDAALVVADPGYAFACEACVGGTGAGSTGSAFMATLINRSGKPILSMREWFATTDEQAAMAAYAVNPLEHDSLFTEHGKKMAVVFSEKLGEQLAEE